MKKLLLLALFATFSFAVDAQELKFPGLDGSPADLAYYPANSAQKNTAPDIKLIYARPSKKGRVVFGELEKYGVVYRLGANESNEITFFKDVTIGGKPVKAGSYSLFAIPNKDKWTLIINSKINSWGAYTYDQAKDVVRTEVPVVTLATPIEALSMMFTKTDTGASLNIGWDTVSVALPITFK
ncbi:MAG TPA: DUF2911 domain-containing protein [Pedobacter sp.]|jgi:hypothetical protein